MSNINVLLAEDETIVALDIKNILESSGYHVPYIASTGEEAIQKTMELSPNLIITDISLKGIKNGVMVASEIKHLNIPIIYLTANFDQTALQEAIKTEPYGFIFKPYDQNEIISNVKKALNKKKKEKDLKEYEKLYHELIDDSLFAIYKTSLDGDIIFANKTIAQMLGYPSVEEFKTKKSTQLYENIDDRAKMIEKIKKEGNLNDYEVKLISFTDEIILIRLNAYLQNDIMTGVMIDITKRQQAENTLKESEKKYRTLFEYNPDYTCLIDSNGVLLDINNAAIDFAGLSKNKLIGKPFLGLKICPIKDSHLHEKMFKKVINEQQLQKYQNQINDQKRNEHWVETRLIPLKLNGKVKSVLAIGTDITEKKKATDKLKTSLKEKEILLRELNHRVKNNMQIISSLLNLQRQQITDNAMAKNLFKQSQNRVRSMSMIHENIYHSQDITQINLNNYIHSLITHLFDSYIVDNQITSQIQVEDMKLNIDTAVPCGLIINEIVSNSLKHAFPDGRKGELKISLKKLDDKYELIISDNGVGFPEKLDYKNTDSLGLQLVNTLVNQLDGTISMDTNHGTNFRVIFRELQYQERM